MVGSPGRETLSMFSWVEDRVVGRGSMPDSDWLVFSCKKFGQGVGGRVGIPLRDVMLYTKMAAYGSAAQVCVFKTFDLYLATFLSRHDFISHFIMALYHGFIYKRHPLQMLAPPRGVLAQSLKHGELTGVRLVCE